MEGDIGGRGGGRGDMGRVEVEGERGRRGGCARALINIGGLLHPPFSRPLPKKEHAVKMKTRHGTVYQKASLKDDLTSSTINKFSTS